MAYYSLEGGIKMGEIGVIVPAYNVEKYLDKCINSILCQTYDNFDNRKIIRKWNLVLWLYLSIFFNVVLGNEVTNRKSIRLEFNLVFFNI